MRGVSIQPRDEIHLVIMIASLVLYAYLGALLRGAWGHPGAWCMAWCMAWCTARCIAWCMACTFCVYHTLCRMCAPTNALPAPCTAHTLLPGSLIGSHLLGAFVAGMCFVNVPRSHQVWVAQFKRIIRWLIRIFFSATVGFAVPLKEMFTLDAFLNGPPPAILTMAIHTNRAFLNSPPAHTRS